MLKLKLQYFGHLMRRVDSLEKTPMLGKIEGKIEMVGWHYWLDGHEFVQAPGVGDGQGSLVCCLSWSSKESDTTEWLNWTELNHFIVSARASPTPSTPFQRLSSVSFSVTYPRYLVCKTQQFDESFTGRVVLCSVLPLSEFLSHLWLLPHCLVHNCSPCLNVLILSPYLYWKALEEFIVLLHFPEVEGSLCFMSAFSMLCTMLLISLKPVNSSVNLVLISS